MNKNTNNNHGKGNPKDQMQNQENRPNDSNPVRRSGNLNKDREPQQVDSWINPNKGSYQKIHPVESSTDQTKTREDEEASTNRSTNQLNREREMRPSGKVEPTAREIKIHPVEPAKEKVRTWENEPNRVEPLRKENLVVEKSPNGIDSASMNKRDSDGAPFYKKQVASEKETAPRASAFQAHQASQSEQGKVKEVDNAPARGMVLYAIAAILLVAWAIGFFFYNAGTLIHVLLILALVSVLINVTQGRK